MKSLYRFNGKEEEFEKLISKYKAVVYGTAYAYFGYNSEIDDVVQETFIEAYFNYGKIREKEKIGAWLCKVARNISLKKLRQTTFTLPLEDYEHIECEDVEETFYRQERNKEIYKAIESLSKPIAETITLFYIAEKTIKEISSLLCVSEGTVKSRLYDGRKKLKGELIHIMEKENSVIKSKDIYTIIKKLIEEAKEAQGKNNMPFAIMQIDKAISKFDVVEKDYKSLAEIYRLRSKAQTNPECAKEDGEKSVAYAKLTGDKRLIAECLLSHAFDLYGEEEEKVFKEAYEIANEIGYYEICAECAFWIGTLRLQCFDYDKARVCFDDALNAYSKISKTDGANCCTGDSIRIHAFANSALASMRMLEEQGRLNSEYVSINIFCQVVRNNTDNIYMDNNYGWNIGGNQPRIANPHRFFGCFECEGIIHSLAMLEKGYEDLEYYTWNGVLVNRHYEIVSRKETIKTEAGAFDNCLHIKITETIPNFESDNKEHQVVFEFLDGSEHWYCENIGLVKSIKSFPNDRDFVQYTRELKSYDVTPSATEKYRYFPSEKGNKWEYVIFDENGTPYSNKYTYRDCYEVDTITDKYTFIANSGFVFEK